jgi:hypothetical protein
VSINTILLVKVGSWIFVTTALTFVEVRHIRKKMYSERNQIGPNRPLTRV